MKNREFEEPPCQIPDSSCCFGINFFIFLIAVFFFASCVRNPVTGKSELHLVSESQEIQMGEQSYPLMQQAQGGDYVADIDLQRYVQKVGNRLARVSDRPSLPYEFVVLNNSIPNAWALPGGKIAINRGLLLELQNEAELAAVLSHEIVHSAARHGAKSVERALLMESGLLGLQQILKDHKYENIAMGSAALGLGVTQLKYSREAELEADRYGIKYMVAAGYNPEAAVTLQETFLRLSQNRQSDWFSGLFASHPPSIERLRANQATVASYPPGGKWGTKEYQDAIAHLKEAEPAYEHLDQGYRALLQDNSSKALFHAEKGIQIEPREGHLHNLKGKAEVFEREYSSALKSFTKAITLNPNYYDFYLQRGLLEHLLGNESQARLDLQKSAQLLPSAEGEYTLGLIDLRAGRESSALEHFRLAAQVDSPIGELARRQIARLQSSRKIPEPK